jgi:hypothetical protein
VVQAFLTHDLATLRKHCGPELMERLEGIFKHFEAQVCYFVTFRTVATSNVSVVAAQAPRA